MKILEGFGILIGVIVGAGIFGLPYAFSQAPISWNIFLFVFVFALSLILHLLLAGIVYTTPGRHRFPGYVQKYLGPRAETIATIFTVLSAYGAMLAYGVLGATFLQYLVGMDFILGGIVFFILGAFLFYMPLNEVGKINFYLTLPLVAFILLLALSVMPEVRYGNFQHSGNHWFLAYGILVFAFGGYSALPDLKDILGSKDHVAPKKVIFWSLFASAIFYAIFIFAILGATGGAATPDALSGLGGVLGREVLVLGSLIGIFTVFRAYVGFGEDLKLMYRYDYEMKEQSSWLLSFLPPAILFLLGFIDLVKILSIVGSVGLGVFAVFILMIAWKRREEVQEFLRFKMYTWWIFLLGFLVIFGALQDIFASFIF